MALAALWLIPFTAVSLAATLAAMVGVGLWAGSRAERVLGRKDPGVIVIDEIAGMLLSVLFLPRTWPVLLVAFLLFRLFDIWKPFPAGASQRLPGGLGIMCDDLVAGAYALLLLHGLRALLGVPA